MNRRKTIRIGVIADTHGLFDLAIRRHFKGVDHILHAGDIGKISVIRQLQTIAPVTAVSGNVDGYGRSGYPSERIVRLGGRRIALRHILYEGGKLTKDGRAFLEREQPDICIFGHTHQPRFEQLGKTLLFNPGSAGPKRFTLPRRLGVLTISKDRCEVHHVSLADTAAQTVCGSVADSGDRKRPAGDRKNVESTHSLKREGKKVLDFFERLGHGNTN